MAPRNGGTMEIMVIALVVVNFLLFCRIDALEKKSSGKPEFSKQEIVRLARRIDGGKHHLTKK